MHYIFQIIRIELCFVVALATGCEKNPNISQSNLKVATKEECVATFLSPDLASAGELSVAVAGEIEINMAKQTIRVGDVVDDFSVCQSAILDICIAASTPLAVASEPGEDVITINGKRFNITSNISQHEISKRIVTTTMKSDEMSVTTIYSQRDGVLGIYDDWGQMYIVEGRLDAEVLKQCSQEG